MVTCTVTGKALARGLHGVENAGQRGFRLQQVLASFDEQHIHAGFDQRARLLFITRGHGVEADVAERRQLGGGPHGAGDEARPAVAGEIGGGFAREFHRGAVDLRDLVLQIVLGEDDAGGAEGVGLDHVAAGSEKAGMDITDDVRAAQHQQLVAAFLAPEVVGRGLAHLYVGAHSAVVDHDALPHGLEKGAHP